MGQTVPNDLRKQANAINRLGINAAQIAGASLGGLLVAAFGSGWGIVIDATTFGVAAVLFSLLRLAAYREPDRPRASTLRELREGWSEFVSRQWLWVVVLGFMFFNMAFAAAIGVLGPAVADASFGRRAWGFILAAETLGMVVGGLLAMRIKVRRMLLLGVVGCFGPALMVAALAVSPQVALLLPVAFVGGLGVEQFGIAWEVSMQEHIPAQKLARVYSYDMLGSFIAIPLGQVAVGPLAAVVGPHTAMAVAAGVAALAVVGMLASPSVRTLEHDPTAHQPAADDPPLAADPTAPVPAVIP
jgi:predicted MFS family arabinose efflux permease